MGRRGVRVLLVTAVIVGFAAAAAGSPAAPGAPPGPSASHRAAALHAQADAARRPTDGEPGFAEVRGFNDIPCDVADLRTQARVCFDRADLVNVTLDYSPIWLTVTLSTEEDQLIDARTDPDWLGATFLAVDIETTGDDQIDHSLLAFWDNDAQSAALIVLDADGTVSCSGTPDRVDGGHLLLVPAGCIDDAPTFRWDALALWDDDQDMEVDHVDIAPNDTSGMLDQRPAGDVGRLAGADRIATALLISQRQFPDTAEAVYLAGAAAFADAVAAGGLRNGPILLVPSCGQLPDGVYDEVQRVDPAEVIALGGTTAVCDDVLDQAARLREGDEPPAPSEQPSGEPSEEPTGEPTPGPVPGLPPLPPILPTDPVSEDPIGPDDPEEPPTRPTRRLAGEDRIATAVAVSREIAAESSGGDVLLTRADVLADAVASGSLDRPLLLVPSCDALPAIVREEIERQQPGRILILGGSQAVCEAVADEVRQLAEVVRIAGSDRYATAAAIAAQSPGSPATYYLANGDSAADAVAAGTLTDGPVLLTPTGCGPAPYTARLAVNGISEPAIIALGGEAAVCQDTLLDLGAARRPD